ncbi:hypothetical protein [Bradyrhizobium sp. BR 10289]|uniref:hypothetical protein n=1 Tax=Bradyrhizobium sp. BR 10289 TaxID=2749993 RepID=UPI001C64A3D8|nr:hypothetical protein [Bradyrhizobium sp. BR 10289]MBW7968622.1 hypothetical protein [Bradyrhizobium sp. BR 10289]
MNIEPASLNAVEKKAYELLKPRLANLGSIVVLKEENDRIRIDVISPHHFQRTAAELEVVAGEIGQATSCSVDVRLTTQWPSKDL